MKTAVKSPESAVYRRGLGVFLTETPLTAAPKHFFRPLFPRNPHFPALQSSPPTSPRLRRSGRLRQAGRSDPTAISGASRQQQIPSSNHLLRAIQPRIFRDTGNHSTKPRKAGNCRTHSRTAAGQTARCRYRDRPRSRVFSGQALHRNIFPCFASSFRLPMTCLCPAAG
jgi:hypothetical protein